MTDTKKVLVTGGSRGIGAVIAKALSEAGHEVFITSRTQQRPAEGVDILINNAGVYSWNKIENTQSQDLENVIKTNLQMPIEMCKQAVPGMKERGWGRIINIGSISGVIGEVNASLYSASKAGLIGLTKSLALELAEYGITANVINPGWVKTSMTEEHLNENVLESIPSKRYIEPEEIADLIKYLISDSARGITGQSINLCGGLCT